MIVWMLATLSVVLAVALALLYLWFRRTPPAPPPPVATAERPGRDPATVLDRMELGVVIMNHALSPVSANVAARKLLHLDPSSLPARLQSDEVVSVARRAMATAATAETELNLWPDRRRVRVRAFPTENDEVVVFLDDVTEEVQAHQVRRQFVVNASHELKTPVAGIQALAETVGQAIDDDPAAAKRFARKLLIESERLSRLIQDLLDLSRLEDPAHFSDAPIDLGAVAEREAAGLMTLAEESGVKLDVDVLGGTVIRGDEQQVALLVRNLIDNAIRYTPESGQVDVRVDHDETDAVLEVEDTGMGIPLNAQTRVFERFFRVDDDRARASGGTGLGLSIVKHVAESHGGHVSLKSELGEGSTFRVRLPLAAGNGR